MKWKSAIMNPIWLKSDHDSRWKKAKQRSDFNQIVMNLSDS